MGRKNNKFSFRNKVDDEERNEPNPQPAIQPVEQVNSEIIRLQKEVEDLSQQKEHLEGERHTLRAQQIIQLSLTNERQNLSGFGYPIKLLQIQDVNPEARFFGKVHVRNLLNLLLSEDAHVQFQATKVIANLSAEERNHKTIVKELGIVDLIMLLSTDCSEDLHRIAAGAIANLAVTHTCQDKIIEINGIDVLASVADNARDVKTVVMVAKAIANLCGNNNLQKEPKVIETLFKMVEKWQQPKVFEEVARGIANFARETRQIKSQSRLLDSNHLAWILENVENKNSAIRLHLEIALCHLVQLENRNRRKIKEKVEIIAKNSSNEDIRSFAENTLNNID